jgi:short-subunit dehydrogenase
MWGRPSTQGVTYGARAVVTGAGSGIGRAIATELAARGSEVVCSDISLERAEETASILRSRGGTAHAVQCDVSSRGQVEELAVTSQLVLAGPISLVVNNAGVGSGGKVIGELGFDDWTRAININLWGPIHGCEIFTPILRDTGRGGIINVASAAAFGSAPFLAPYCVSKSAVLALSEVLAAELSDTDINVSVLCPTFVKTNIAKDPHVDQSSARLAQRLIDAIGTSPESIARTVLDAHDSGNLYILPQIDAKVLWALKRFVPRTYGRGQALLYRVSNSPAFKHEAESPTPSATKASSLRVH